MWQISLSEDEVTVMHPAVPGCVVAFSRVDTSGDWVVTMTYNGSQSVGVNGGTCGAAVALVTGEGALLWKQ